MKRHLRVPVREFSTLRVQTNELRYTSRVELDGAATTCTDVFLLLRD